MTLGEIVSDRSLRMEEEEEEELVKQARGCPPFWFLLIYRPQPFTDILHLFVIARGSDSLPDLIFYINHLCEVLTTISKFKCFCTPQKKCCIYMLNPP